ncbi:MAG: cobalt/nickel transport system ATP-binding protein [Candidatus Electronema aureum]|uniref:Cobalt/nickel transport system ATP-binding protein n=1 Tax=Candidatus Electronema aureum TaxID=2005002 RepID=A0A521G5A9_9BACT|nr:MAG: cobalt/nickel transport system ATP-binding protein [Candidatus Electronema aureum]
MPANPTLIQLQQVSFAYPGSSHLLLNQADVTLDYRQRIGLIGPNGSGKTTLLHIIMGLLRPTAGRLLFKGQEISSKEEFRKLRRSIGLVFQDADDQLFSPTVIEDIAFGPLNLGMNPAEALRISRQTLADLGLSALAERVTHQLSGGEKKLISLATILSMQPEAMLLDEPTNNLDSNIRTRLISILNRLEIGYMIISHDWDFLAETCDEIYTLSEGCALRSGTECLHSHHHVHTYGDRPHEHQR